MATHIIKDENNLFIFGLFDDAKVNRRLRIIRANTRIMVRVRLTPFAFLIEDAGEK